MSVPFHESIVNLESVFPLSLFRYFRFLPLEQFHHTLIVHYPAGIPIRYPDLESPVEVLSSGDIHTDAVDGITGLDSLSAY